MKFCLCFKTPDVLDEIESLCLSDDEQEECLTLAKKFVENGEYIRIEFDTDRQTAKVIKDK